MKLDAGELEQAAWIALQIPIDYTRKRRNLAWAAMAGAKNLELHRHYPLHDVIDPVHQTRFYYHAHPIDGGEREHGHFHIFLDVAPGRFHHLVSLALDPQGRPTRWFCTNRWVTGETWANANELKPKIQGFRVNTRGKLAPVARWLEAMIRLDTPRLLNLLDERDLRLAQAHGKDHDLWEDRSIHVLASVAIDLSHSIQTLNNAPSGVTA